MSSAQSPLAVQQTTLAAIDAEVARFQAYASTCPVGGTAEAIGQWVTSLDEFVWRLHQLAPSAAWLAQQGLPGAGQRLEAVTRDLTGARQVYVEMYQNKVASDAKIRGIWADAERFTTRTIQQVTEYRAAVFNNSMQGYFDVTENRCFDCHQLIGIPGGGYCFTCARRRRWI